MLKRIFTICWLSLSLPMFSITLEDIEESKDTTRKDISNQEFDFNLNQEFIKEIGEIKRDKNQREFKVPKNFRLKESGYKPTPFRAIIQAGAKLTTVGGELKKYYIEKPLYATVQLPYEGSPFSTILNKEGKPAYEVDTMLVTSIEEDLDMDPKVDATVTYNRQKNKYFDDKAIIFENYFSFGYETITANYFSQLFNDNSTSAVANRYELKTIYKSSIPIDYGLMVNYQAGVYNKTSDDVNFNAFFLGPVAKANLYKAESWRLDADIFVLRSIIFDAKDSIGKYGFSSVELGMSAKIAWDTFIGPFFGELSLRNQRTSIERTPIQFETVRENTSIVGISFGYQYDFNL